VARVIDIESAGIVTLRLSPKTEAIVLRVRSLPGPVTIA
jgi:hypothetical protein